MKFEHNLKKKETPKSSSLLQNLTLTLGMGLGVLGSVEADAQTNKDSSMNSPNTEVSKNESQTPSSKNNLENMTKVVTSDDIQKEQEQSKEYQSIPVFMIRPEEVTDESLVPVIEKRVRLNASYDKVAITKSTGKGDWILKSYGSYTDILDISKYNPGYYRVVLTSSENTHEPTTLYFKVEL